MQTLFTPWFALELHFFSILQTRNTPVYFTPKTHTPFVPPHFTHKNSFVSIAILQKHYTALLHILHLNCVTSLLDLQVPVPVYCSAVDYKFLYHTWWADEKIFLQTWTGLASLSETFRSWRRRRSGGEGHLVIEEYPIRYSRGEMSTRRGGKRIRVSWRGGGGYGGKEEKEEKEDKERS